MLEAQNLCKSYGGRQVLFPVSFRLEAGESLGIVGPNGSGKSTLLRLLAQVHSPDSGDLLFDGHSILGQRKFLRRHLGYVPQDDSLSPELTVVQQLSLWQAACGFKGALEEQALALMGLESLLHQRIGQLSGGMRRRVSIAMALLTRPEILIMDEATSGLDQTYCLALMDWLMDFSHQGGYLIWCTHRTEEVEQLCGRCLRLQDGLAQWGGMEPGEGQ